MVDDTHPPQAYPLDAAAAEAAPRFDAFAAIYDPVTSRVLTGVGVRPGWRCWEVGAGGATIPNWLAAQVGSSGHVLATDIRTDVLDAAADDTVEVRRHDIVRDELPEPRFDLIHSRLVLVHLPDPEAVLHRLVVALRPGGVLVVEDTDTDLQPLVCPDVRGPDEELANRVKTAFRDLLATTGTDRGFGRRLPRLLRAAGLSRVAASGFFPLADRAVARLEAATVRQVRDRLASSGAVSAADLDRYLELLDRDALDLTMPPVVSAWGFRRA